MGLLTASQSICDHDIIAERWRQLRLHGQENRTDQEWSRQIADLAVLLDMELIWRDRAAVRSGLVQLAERAVAWICDLDSRAGDRAVLPDGPKVLEGAGA